MNRSQIKLPVYFDRYINLTDDITVSEALNISLNELTNAPVAQWESIGDTVYAEGKWTIKDILQHIIDTERVFCYRALSFARGEGEVKPFDEDTYATMAHAVHRSIEDLLEELIVLRKATILLYKSFNDKMLAMEGVGFKGSYSVLAIGFILAGHQRWHYKIIEERYLPLMHH
ncbi:MAG: DinB family protein [Bacteroidota bacterium]